MLIRSTWTLRVNAPTTLPKSYRLELSKHLHNLAGLEVGGAAMPNTTFAGLQGRVQYTDGFVTLQPDEFYQLSLSGLQKDVSGAIASLDLPDTLDLLGARFKVIDRVDDTTSYEALYHRYVADEPEPERQITLSFPSPTAFSQNRTYLPLPVPMLMLRSWLERWNEFAPVYLGKDDLVGYLGETVVLSRHRIQTQAFPIHKGMVSGFTGTVTLSMLQRGDSLLAQVANLLTHYAQFSGTGIKTRLGMGYTIIQRS